MTLVLGILGLLEYFIHCANLKNIRIRIHVNGTRGKSSVTRLIAAGFREAGIETCAKTTGTLARMILPDGSEYPVYRNSRPNVIEQVRIVATAASLKAEALVLECMAIQPHLQFLSERKFIRATHTVITNVRPDHLESMGPTEKDVALAFAGTVPKGGVLFTAEKNFLPFLAKVAENHRSTLVAVGKPDVAGVSAKDMGKFTYLEHPENVALALRICEEFGIKRRTALRGMWKAPPDPGVFAIHEIHFFGGRKIFFANGFAANDPQSTQRIWHMAIQKTPGVGRRIVIFNCRADRPDRSEQLGKACVHWHPADHYLLIGSGTYLFARAARAEGMDPAKISFAEHRSVADIFEIVVDIAGKSALVMGMGNIAEPGLELVRYFRNRSLLEEAA
jgi:poly-gamma-glutamate synthase PgsB/CapB